MNQLPDAFEWNLARKGFVGISAILAVLYLVSVGLIYLPGQLRFPHPEVAAGLRIFGLGSTGLFLWVIMRLKPGAPSLSAWIIGSLLVHLLTTLAVSLTSDTSRSISEAAFIISSSLYLILFGFFTRNQGATVLFGAALLGIAVLLFGVPGRSWPPETDRTADGIFQALLFSIALMTALVWAGNQASRSLADHARTLAASLEALAYFDGDTGLPNAKRLERQVRELPGPELLPPRRLALAAFRITGLDELNGSLGLEATTAAVTRVIGRFADRLKTELGRPEGLETAAGLEPLYRLDGATFLMALVVSTDRPSAYQPVPGALAALLEDESLRLNRSGALGYRGGFTLYPDDGDSPAQLVRNVLNLIHDGAARSAGQFAPFNAAEYRTFLRRITLQEGLAEGLGSEAVETVFQPKVSLADRRLVGLEALVRWSHPALGPVSPGEFVPLAERTGAIEPLTLGVLTDTTALIRRFQAAGRPPVRVSVNLTPGLLRPAFLGRLTDAVRQGGVGSLLEFEITEGTLMILDDDLRRQLSGLRNLGVTFAIDDFGTGYSNLGYLQNFEAEVLKIDKRFIDGIPADPKSRKLVGAIVQMGKSFNMTVVAEGVEHLDQVEFLRDSGCDQIQGWVYSAALTADQALVFSPG